MGGMGSGTWYRYSSKPTEENYWRFSMSDLKRHGVIKVGKRASGNWWWRRGNEQLSSIGYEINTLDYPCWLRVHYTNKGTGEDYNYKIYLTTSRPSYGGVRWWFHCPIQGCDRRVSVLYLGHLLACRHCCNITYSSQNRSFYDRMADKAFRLASQLEHDGNVMEGFYGQKPKGMHWKTYHRKVKEIEQAASLGLLGVAVKYRNVFPCT